MPKTIYTETFTGSIFDIKTTDVVKIFRKTVGKACSRLQLLSDLLKPFSDLCNVTLVVKPAKDICTETYSFSYCDFKIRLKIESYATGSGRSSVVRSPSSANQSNALLTSVWSYWNTYLATEGRTNDKQITFILEMIDTAIKQCSMSSIFQTEIEDAEWNILFNDSTYGCNAELSIIAM